MTAVETPDAPRPSDPAPASPPGRPRGRTALIAALSVALVMGVLIAVLARSPAATDVQARSPLVGKQAPAIDTHDLSGQAVRLSDYRGKYVLVNFFASWCVPCRQEQADLTSWYQEHAGAGDATVLGVVFSDSADAARKYEQETGGTWPVVGPDDQVALDYGVRGQPESYFVDPNGVVLVKIVGRVTAGGLDRLLAQAKALGA